MSVQEVVKQVVVVVTPFVPMLLAAGEKVVDGALDAVGGSLEAGAKKLALRVWNTIRPAVTANEKLESAPKVFAQDPAEEAVQALFAKRLQDVLEKDETLTSELKKLFAESDSKQYVLSLNSYWQDVKIRQFGAGLKQVEANNTTFNRDDIEQSTSPNQANAEKK